MTAFTGFDRAQCGDCVFAKGYSHPGDPPIEPVKPEGFWSFFWDGDRAWMNYRWDEAYYGDRKNCHENLVRCHRFPEYVAKEKTDSCGEWKQKPSLSWKDV